MTKTMQKTRRAVLALLVMLPMLLALSVPALAASGADTVEIGGDGTVTVVSDRMAGEMISSVQVSVRVSAAPGGAVSFSFDAGLAGRLTESSYRDGTLNIYVAGTAPLLAAGQSRLTLGVISGGDLGSVELPADALQFVYGTRVIAQSADAQVLLDDQQAQPEETPDAGSDEQPAPAPSPDSAARERLRQALDQAGDITPEGYTQTSYEQFLAALAAAEAVFARADATDAELDDAAAALEKAIEKLVPVAEADGSGPVIGDGADDGAGSGAPEPTAAPDVEEPADPDEPSSSEPEPTAEAGSTAEAEPTAEIEPTAVPEPTAEAEPTAEPGPTAEAESTAEPGPTAEPKPTDDTGPSISPEFPGEAQATTAPTAVVTQTPAPDGAQAGAPDTGDDTPVSLWTLVLCLSGALLAAVMLRRGKYRQ